MVNPFAITLLCMGGAAALIFLLWLNHVLRMGTKREAQEAPRKAAPAPSWVSYGLSYLLGGAGPVNSSEEAAPSVMSRGTQSAPENSPSSLRQTAIQTDRQEERAAPTRDIMLNTYRVLRKHGMPREEARGMLKALGLPLDNNQWTEAAPVAEEPTQRAPVSGRPIPAGVRFHEDDPDLEYQPLRA